MTKFKFGILVVAATGVLSIWFRSVTQSVFGLKEPISAKDDSVQLPVAISKAGTDPNGSSRRALVKNLPPHRKASREGIEHEAGLLGGKQEAVSKNEEIPPTPEPQRTAADFIMVLRDAVAKSDAGAVQELWQKLPRNAECVEALEGLVAAQDCSKDLRRYAAEALVRIGTRESVSFLLDHALAANGTGDSSRCSALLDALDSPTTVEGARALLDLLLGTGRYTELRNDLPEEFRAAARKALRNAPDREGIGNLATQLYLDPQISGRNEAIMELFDSVAHPNMLSTLAVRSLQAGSEESARKFMDRIVRDADQGAVQALVHAGSTEARLLNLVAERLYQWSLQHPEQAQPGLFLDYLNDSKRAPNERILGAYGLAGVANKDATLVAISKTLAEETDPDVRASLTALRNYMTQTQPQK